MLASLAPEEAVIAEQVLRGGVPGVRQAIEEQNTAARAAGNPELPTDALMGMAERLLPRLRAADWQDRAEAAIDQVDDVALRDLRALVAGSDAAGRDEASRDLATRLKEALDARAGRERDAWLAEINEALESGRIVRALRSSCRPPDPGVRFPADLAERLATAAGEALGPEVAADRWAALLEAVTASPVRRTVKPRGLPNEPGAELLRVVRQSVERVPGLGPLVGSPAPPPIGARRPGPPPAPKPSASVAADTPALADEVTAPLEDAPVLVAEPPPVEVVAVVEEPVVVEQPTAEAAPAFVAEASPVVEPAASGDDGDDAVLVEELR